MPNIYLAQALHARGENRRAIESSRANVDYLTREGMRERFGMPGLPAVSSELVWIAVCMTELGAFDQARWHAGQARQIAEAYGGPFDAVYVNTGVGLTYLRQGYFGRACAFLEAALEVCRTEEILHMYSVCTSHLGEAYVMSGRLDEGLPLLELAVRQSADLGIRAAHSVWETRRAEGYLLAGRLNDAMTVAETVLKQIRAQGERGYEAYALRVLGLVHAAMAAKGSVTADSAEGYLATAGSVAETLEQRPLRAHCHLGLRQAL